MDFGPYPESTIAGTVYMCGYTKAWYLRYDKDCLSTEALVYVGRIYGAIYVLMALLEK